jgi:hypothetical protein
MIAVPRLEISRCGCPASEPRHLTASFQSCKQSACQILGTRRKRLLQNQLRQIRAARLQTAALQNASKKRADCPNFGQI